MESIVYVGGPYDGRIESVADRPSRRLVQTMDVRILPPAEYGLPEDMTCGMPAIRCYYYDRGEARPDGTVVYRLVGDGVKM